MENDAPLNDIGVVLFELEDEGIIILKVLATDLPFKLEDESSC